MERNKHEILNTEIK